MDLSTVDGGSVDHTVEKYLQDSENSPGTITVIKRNAAHYQQQQQDDHCVTKFNTELSKYATESLDTDGLPSADTLTAPKLCSLRIKQMIDLLKNDKEIDKSDIINNLTYSMSVLDTLYVEETSNMQQLVRDSPTSPTQQLLNGTRRLFEDDDVLNEVGPDAVPSEVREWLAQTFTKSSSISKVRGERPKFKSVAQAIRAGIMVDRIYRKVSNSNAENHLQPPEPVARLLKDVNRWEFDIWELNKLSENHSLRYMGYELLNRQGLVSKLKISAQHLDNFLTALETGYSKHGNPYHNLIHAADVSQTTYYLIQNSGLMKWLTDIEIYAIMIASLIHDYEHTGTTNNYHIMTDSQLARLYNDKSVLENHHVSSAFDLMRSEDMNILSGLSKEQYREFRSLVIDMVLATDMSSHFTQLKNMKSLLSCPENIEKSKALCLILHAADISHPSKPWLIHKPWTDRLIEEFFKQGDREKELGLPCSPLCDRQTTLVEKSQIGFIDFIVKPTMNILGDMLEKIVASVEKNESNSQKSTDTALLATTLPKCIKVGESIERAWDNHLPINRQNWCQLAGCPDDKTNNNEKENEAERTTPKPTSHQGMMSRTTSTTGLFEITTNRRKVPTSRQTSTTELIDTSSNESKEHWDIYNHHTPCTTTSTNRAIISIVEKTTPN